MDIFLETSWQSFLHLLIFHVPLLLLACQGSLTCLIGCVYTICTSAIPVRWYTVLCISINLTILGHGYTPLIIPRFSDHKQGSFLLTIDCSCSPTTPYTNNTFLSVSDRFHGRSHHDIQSIMVEPRPISFRRRV